MLQNNGTSNNKTQDSYKIQTLYNYTPIGNIDNRFQKQIEVIYCLFIVFFKYGKPCGIKYLLLCYVGKAANTFMTIKYK